MYKVKQENPISTKKFAKMRDIQCIQRNVTQRRCESQTNRGGFQFIRPDGVDRIGRYERYESHRSARCLNKNKSAEKNLRETEPC